MMRVWSLEVKRESVSGSVMSSSLQSHELQPSRPLCLWNAPDKKYWSGQLFLSPWGLPNPGTNLSHLYCRQILYCLSHQGSPLLRYNSHTIESPSVVCNSLRPHELQPTRLLCPWDSPGKKYWSGLLCPSPADLPNPGIKPMSLMSPAQAGRFFTTSTTWETLLNLSSSEIYFYM